MKLNIMSHWIVFLCGINGKDWPKKGHEYRQKMSGYFIGKMAELFLKEEVKKLAVYFSDKDKYSIETDLERGIVRNFLYNYNQLTKIPIDMQVEVATLILKSQQVWQEVYKKSDYSIFKPYLENIFNLKIKSAEIIDDTTHPFDVLANLSDEEINIHKVEILFTELKLAIFKNK